MDNYQSISRPIRLKKTLGGMIDYYRYPGQRDKWGGPFNNQSGRQQIFKDLLHEVPFQCIVETGTFRGTTTEYLQEQSGLPVYTVEIQPRKYGFAKARFFFNKMVQVSWGDSRGFLQALARQDIDPGAPVFFYLDAHWGADLPLNEELDIVFERWPGAIVMVDDFRVPDDDGYGYDDYGDGKILEPEYLTRARHGNLAQFYPATPSAQETGKRRGCVVLAREPQLIENISRIESLRRQDGTAVDNPEPSL